MPLFCVVEALNIAGLAWAPRLEDEQKYGAIWYKSICQSPYWLISPAGELTKHLLGTDLHQGQQMQLLVPGGYWKATMLETGEYGLLTEVVIPGFQYADMTLATAQDVQDLIPAAAWHSVKQFIKPQ